MNRKVRDRFFKQVEKQKGRDPCWLWAGRRDHRGYGQFFAYGREYKAHRFLWQFICGRVIPPGLELHHKYRNRNCVNPNHLQVYTHQENMELAQLAGVWQGICNSQHKRTEEEVHQVRLLVSMCIPKTWIAEKMGIPLRSIYYCLSGWQHLETPIREMLKSGQR